jgi:nucleotide-binding universal stress UspA family protein
MKITRVCCPVDFSDTSRKALRYASAIATWYDAVLDVLHVMPDLIVTPDVLAGAPDISFQMRAATDAAFKEFVDDADISARLAGLFVDRGTPSTQILKHARETHPDLLVLGTHGRTGLGHLLLGSQAERVVAHAGCPVMTIPPHAHEVRSPAFAQFKRIVAACDFSDSSNHALAYATSLAQENDATLTLLHVVDVVADQPLLAAANPRAIASIDRLTAQAHETLQQLAARDTSQACETVDRVELGPAAPTILRVADEVHADLIVMGAQSHGAVGVLVYGSTTQTVLRRAACPVLTARAPAAAGD